MSIDRKQRPGALLKEYIVEKAKVQHKNTEKDTAVGEYSREECPRRQEKRKKRKMNNGDRSNVEISGRC